MKEENLEVAGSQRLRKAPGTVLSSYSLLTGRQNQDRGRDDRILFASEGRPSHGKKRVDYRKIRAEDE